MTEAEYQQLREELRQDYLSTIDFNFELNYVPEIVAGLREEDKERIKYRHVDALVKTLNLLWNQMKNGNLKKESQNFVKACRKTIGEQANERYFLRDLWLYQIYKKRRERINQRNRRKAYCKAWGEECARCGEQVIEFLAIHHIKGDGKAERILAGKGDLPNRKRMKQGSEFHAEVQVLCCNCHQSIGKYGYCPASSKTKHTDRVA